MYPDPFPLLLLFCCPWTTLNAKEGIVWDFGQISIILWLRPRSEDSSLIQGTREHLSLVSPPPVHLIPQDRNLLPPPPHFPSSSSFPSVIFHILNPSYSVAYGKFCDPSLLDLAQHTERVNFWNSEKSFSFSKSWYIVSQWTQKLHF